MKIIRDIQKSITIHLSRLSFLSSLISNVEIKGASGNRSINQPDIFLYLIYIPTISIIIQKNRPNSTKFITDSFVERLLHDPNPKIIFPKIILNTIKLRITHPIELLPILSL